MSALDVARYMPEVAELLFGQRNKELSTKGEWRYGSHGSLRINPAAGTWFDYEADQGGGVLDLIAREEHCDRAHAMLWLFDHVAEAAEEAAEADRANGHAKPNGHTKPKPEIVETYDYVTATGDSLFQVVRFEPKAFRQRRPDPDRKGHWFWNLDGIGTRPLYRLPELLTADPTEIVYLCEGEKDVDRLRSLGLTATTTAQGAKAWNKSDHAPLHGRHVVIMPDNDDAGRGYLKDAAAELAGKAASVRMVDLPGLPPKGDVSDWLDAGGTPVALAEILAKVKAPRPALVWADEIALELDHPGVVDGLIPRTGIGVSYGESGSGKTFVVLDRACHIAAGEPWRGLDVEQGIVVYIAAESPESVKRRVWAWKKHHQVDKLPLVIVQTSVDMLNGSTVKLVDEVVKITTERGRIAMVVVDTLSRAMIGNENAPDDMGKFVSACGQLRDAADTFVLVVHHCGKNAALGARGHSSLRAATDFEEEISLNEDGEGTIRTTKNRDDQCGRALGFRLDTFELGENRKGRMVTTCVVREAEPPAKAEPKTPVGAVQQTLLGELRKLYRRHPGGVEEASLKSAFIAALHAKREREGKPPMAAKHYTDRFNKVLASSIAAGHVDRLEDDLLVPT